MPTLAICAATSSMVAAPDSAIWRRLRAPTLAALSISVRWSLSPEMMTCSTGAASSAAAFACHPAVTTAIANTITLIRMQIPFLLE
ncbi:hypothetical protein [Janthinobacterium sp. RB2R34]|uniref:hypothetical protein n=1 Tax=Janthinobacterium sp. RB2R34 TaxID=3424193 RepID=UPI003F240577